MEEVAPGLWRLSLRPLGSLNVYLLGDVLLDSGDRFGRKSLLAALEGHQVAAHAMTHAHFDHQGASRAVCERFGIPLWCGVGDRAAMESGDMTGVLPARGSWLARVAKPLGGPGHPVSRSLREGDEVGGFVVVEAPGHTPGHLAFWREGERALVLGDVLFHRNPVTLRSGLTEPFQLATFDPALNRETARRLAALRPEVICFGHGPPLRDGEWFSEFVSRLPRE